MSNLNAETHFSSIAVSALVHMMGLIMMVGTVKVPGSKREIKASYASFIYVMVLGH